MVRLLITFAAATLAIGQAQQTTDPPRGTRVIDAVAYDHAGKAVMDLKPSEVEVWVGHFKVPIETFTVVTPGADERNGRFFVLLLDDISVPLPLVPRVKEAAHRFIGALLPNDQMAVVMLNNPSVEVTGDAAKLRRAVDSYYVKATGVQRADQLGGQVLSTIGSIASAFVEAGEGRKTIVGIGSGWLLDRPIPNPMAGGDDLLQVWIAAMGALSRTNSTFYVIDPAGLGSARVDGGDSGFAHETGGMGFLNVNDLNGAVDRILRESASHYAIKVGNPPVGGTGLREVELRVKRRGVTIRARRAIH
jgi:VWFA-related protein